MSSVSRLYLLSVAAAFGASGTGSWLGVGPSWPDPKAWAILAWCAGATAVFHAVVPSPARLRCMTAVIVCVGSLRIAGFLLAATSPGSRWGGTGGWALIVILALRAHVTERKVLTR